MAVKRVLFIDDQPELRLEAASSFFRCIYGQDVKVTHSFSIPTNIPKYQYDVISFDNDLGPYGETYPTLRRMYFERTLDKIIHPEMEIIIHSMNNVANSHIAMVAKDMNVKKVMQIPFWKMQ